ncbi:MAG: hypothetical protein AB1775_05195 [Bacteroidota bacterium]
MSNMFIRSITKCLFLFLGFISLYAQEAKYPTLSESKIIVEGDSGKWDQNKVHTLSVVVANKEGYKYWGYYGLSYYGGDPSFRKAGLIRSNDLVHWDKYEGNPIIKGDCRWPTVVLVNSVYYMFYAEYNEDNDSRIVMLSSEDGINFDNKTVVVPMEKGKQNQNPFIYFNDQDGYIYLTYYSGIEKNLDTNSVRKSLDSSSTGKNLDSTKIERSLGPSQNIWTIKLKKSKTVDGLKDAESKTLLSSPSILAAPSVTFYRDKYYLLTEAFGPKWDNKWVTLSYESKEIEGPYEESSNNPVLSDNDACAFQYVLDNQLYIFYSHCLNLIKWDWELRMVHAK